MAKRKPKGKRTEMLLTSAERLQAVAALISMGNGLSDLEAARAAGVHVATLRAWMRRPWWPRVAALAEQALPAGDRRNMLRRRAEGVINQHLGAGSIKAAELVARHVGLFGDDAADARLGDEDLSELSTAELARMARLSE